MGETLVQSVVKAMKILDILVFEDLSGKGFGLFELARKMGQRPNTLHNLLKTMIACGYVEQNSDSRYMAGPKCGKIGMLNTHVSAEVMSNMIEPVLTDLSERIRENVVLTVLANGRRIPVLRMNYDGHVVRVDTSFEEGQDIYTLNTGRILVAYADRYEFELVVKRWGMPGERWDNINNPEDFERVGEKIRKDGHIVTTVNNEEIVSFSVPVLDSRGRIIYALGSYAPSFRCPDEKRREIITEMKKAAKSIEKMLSMRS